jgi:hypothetical protein
MSYYGWNERRVRARHIIMVTMKCTKRAEFLTLPSKYEVDLLDLINLQKSKGAEKLCLAVWQQ